MKTVSLRELVKNEIDMLPDDALDAVRGFVRSQKECVVSGWTQKREKNAQWLEESWIINDFKPLTRKEIYDRI